MSRTIMFSEFILNSSGSKFILLTKKIWEGNAGRPFFDFDPFTANLIEEGRSREWFPPIWGRAFSAEGFWFFDLYSFSILYNIVFYCRYYMQYYIVLHCIVLQCIVLHCIVLQCIVLHCIALHCIYCIALYCIVLYCIVLYCIALYCTILYCTVLHYIVLFGIVLYYIVLHCIVLHCIVLHCIVLYRTIFSNRVPNFHTLVRAVKKRLSPYGCY